jgi:hypothetical protein
MKKIIILSAFSLMIGCTRYSFVESKGGLSVFLNEVNGELIYVGSNNQIFDRVFLYDSARNTLEVKNKTSKGKEFGEKETIAGNYTVSLRIRYFENSMLYDVTLKPFDKNARRVANSINIFLLDDENFCLGNINPTDWTTVVDKERKEDHVSADGSIPVTLTSYCKINNWSFSSSDY